MGEAMQINLHNTIYFNGNMYCIINRLKLYFIIFNYCVYILYKINNSTVKFSEAPLRKPLYSGHFQIANVFFVLIKRQTFFKLNTLKSKHLRIAKKVSETEMTRIFRGFTVVQM